MKYLYLLPILVFITSLSFAQDIDEDVMIGRVVKGYIIFSNTSDTTWGIVKVSTRTTNQIKVNFLADSTSRWKTYKARKKKIIAYGYETKEHTTSAQPIKPWRHFLVKEADQPPAPFTSRTVFMEVKAIGDINLYSYYVIADLKTEITYKHNYYIEQKFSEAIDAYRTRKVTRDNFEPILQSFIEDCPEIEKKLSYLLDYSTLPRVIEIYNKCEKENIGCGGIEPID